MYTMKQFREATKDVPDDVLVFIEDDDNDVCNLHAIDINLNDDEPNIVLKMEPID